MNGLIVYVSTEDLAWYVVSKEIYEQAKTFRPIHPKKKDPWGGDLFDTEKYVQLVSELIFDENGEHTSNVIASYYTQTFVCKAVDIKNIVGILTLPTW